jgi:preprotein translocase subunit SecG
MNSHILLIAQIVISIFLIAAVLLQAQGSGLGSTWSGGGESYHTRRGVEKILFRLTIVLIALFLVVSLATIALR